MIRKIFHTILYKFWIVKTFIHIKYNGNLLKLFYDSDGVAAGVKKIYAYIKYFSCTYIIGK